jgi:hypothetical protein
MNGTRVLMMAALVAAMICGCGPKKQPTNVEPEPPPPASANEELGLRVVDLRKHADALAEVNKKLPGRTVELDNALVADAFEHLAAALTDLGGAQPDGAYRQQVQLLIIAREKLLAAPAETAEPTIDSGLRAASNALIGMHRRFFSRNRDIGPLIDHLNRKLPELDKVHDPLHRLPVSDVFNAISQVLQTMTRVLETNVNAQLPPDPATQPTTTTAPTTATATQPATAPTTTPTSVPATRPAAALPVVSPTAGARPATVPTPPLAPPPPPRPATAPILQGNK